MRKPKLKYFVMDVDGTLTDGKIYMGNDGELFKAFYIKDGCGIQHLLIPSGIIPVIMTGRKSEIVLRRCMELGITEAYQGLSDKLGKLLGMTYNLSEIAYIGDHINDLPCMKSVKAAGAIVGCPGDAAAEVKKLADYVSKYNGGEGAVRDFIEWIVG